MNELPWSHFKTVHHYEKGKKLNRHNNHKGCELEGDVMTPCQEQIAVKSSSHLTDIISVVENLCLSLSLIYKIVAAVQLF